MKHIYNILVMLALTQCGPCMADGEQKRFQEKAQAFFARKKKMQN